MILRAPPLDHISAALLSLLLVAFYIGNTIPLIVFWAGVLFFTGYTLVFLREAFRASVFPFLNTLIRAPLFWLAIAILISFGISSATGINPDKTIPKWGTICAIVGGGFIWYLALRGLNRSFAELLPRYIFIALILTSFIYLTEAIVWKITGHSLHSERFMLTMRKLGAIYAILVPFAMLYILKADRWRNWAGLVFCTFIVFFCGGRSGAVAYVIMVFLFAYFFPWGQVANWGRSLVRYSLAHIIGAAAGIAGYFLMAGSRQFVHRVASERAATGSGRTDIWGFSWGHFLDHPVFGIGVQGFRYLDFSGVTLRSTSHPHNILVELLLETGIVGTVLICTFVLTVLFKTVYSAHRSIPTDPYNIRPMLLASGISLVSFSVSAQFMTSFFHAWWLTYPTILISLTGALYLIYRRETAAYQADMAQTTFPVTVSVVMPCHNGAGFIAAAIESVQAQSMNDWELLIVNDGSTDGSQDIIARYAANDQRIRSLVHETAQGAGPARNTGLDNARGRYVAFLDCDDLWNPEKLAEQIAAMKDAGAILSTTHYDVINDDSEKVGTVTPRDKIFTFGRLLKCNDIGCSAAMIDRTQLGDMRFPSYQKAQDFVFWCEILRRGNFCLCLSKNFGAYRIHANSRTLNKVETAKNRIRLLKEAIGVPLLVMPYYIALYVLYGVSKQLRSGSR